MLIVCSKCKVQGVIDSSKIHDNGRTVNCNKCNYTFVVATEYIDVLKVSHEIRQNMLVKGKYSKEYLHDEVNRVIIDKCNTLEKKKINCLEILFKRAEAFYKLGIYDLALRDLEKAILLQPKYAKLYNLAGDVYFKTGDYTKSINNFNLSASYDLYNIDPIINKSRVYIKLGKYELAREGIDMVLRLEPQSKAALMLKFTVNLLIGNSDAACNDASVIIVNLNDMVNSIEENTNK